MIFDGLSEYSISEGNIDEEYPKTTNKEQDELNELVTKWMTDKGYTPNWYIVEKPCLVELEEKNKMKIDYNNIEATKPAWKVGDVVHSVNDNLYLVAKVADLNEEESGYFLYTLIDLESGSSLGSCETIEKLQFYFYGVGDKVLNGTFKYIGDDND